jgi:hypothetical protein
MSDRAAAAFFAIFPILGRAENPLMNARRANEAAGRHIEVHFTGESEALLVDLPDGTDDDAVAAALVGCLDALTVDDAEGRLQEGLEGRGGTVRRAP